MLYINPYSYKDELVRRLKYAIGKNVLPDDIFEIISQLINKASSDRQLSALEAKAILDCNREIGEIPERIFKNPGKFHYVGLIMHYDKGKIYLDTSIHSHELKP